MSRACRGEGSHAGSRRFPDGGGERLKRSAKRRRSATLHALAEEELLRLLESGELDPDDLDLEEVRRGGGAPSFKRKRF